MQPNYLIVMQSEDGLQADLAIKCDDDIQAIVAARRLFVQETVSTRRPLSLKLGRAQADGQVLWFDAWSSVSTAPPGEEASVVCRPTGKPRRRPRGAGQRRAERCRRGSGCRQPRA
jgi:hypothetical protein